MKSTKRLTSTLVPPHFQNFSPVDSANNPDVILERETERLKSMAEAAAHHSKKKWHMPLLRFKANDVCSEGAAMFFDAVNPKKLLEEAVMGVMETLYTHETQPRNVRSVTLILRAMSGVAYTTGSDLDNDHKEIHLSTDYLKGVHERSEGKLDKREILGVIRHEMVHCFQFNGRGTANGGLIEGIADWVRFKAGFIPPHWKKGGGNDWDDGYQNTAYFLLYLEERFGLDTVPRINEYMREKRYSETLWKDLFKVEVKTLWEEYRKTLDDPESKRPVSPAPGETCIEDPKEKGKEKEPHDDERSSEPDSEDSPVVVEHPLIKASRTHKHATLQDIPYLTEPFVAAEHENDGKRHVILAATGSVATIKLPLMLEALGRYRHLSVRVVLTTASLLFLPPLQTLLELPNVDGIYLDHHEWPSGLQTDLPPQASSSTSSGAPGATPSPIPKLQQPLQGQQEFHQENTAIWAKVGDPILHIELRRWAHIMLIAPLSANSMAKITSGLSDNLLMCVVRAWDRSRMIAVAPAMNTLMWDHPLTRQQLRLLGDDSDSEWDYFKMLRPTNKMLACGDMGSSAMMEWSDIVAWLVDKMDLAEIGSKT